MPAWSPSTSCRSGAALILVLAVAVILLAAAGAAAMAAQDAHGELVALRREGQVEALRESAERLIPSWVASHGARVVAPPEGGSWTILDDQWTTPTRSGRLIVTLFDGWAGIPLGCAHAQGVLHRQVPPVLSGVSLPEVPLGTAALQQPQPWIATLPLPPGVPRFPTPQMQPTATRWGSSADGSSGVGAIPWSQPGESLVTGISARSDGRININTAPVAVIEAVYRLRQETVPAHLIEARRQGRRSEAPPDAGLDARLPRLSDGSLVWNALITAESEGVVRSWWVVFVAMGNQVVVSERHRVPDRRRAP